MCEQHLINALNETFATFDRVLPDERARLKAVEVGKVSSVGKGTARVSGLNDAQADELLEFPHHVMGMAFNLDVEEIGVILLDHGDKLCAGDEVRRSGRVLDVPVGDELLGRVIDPLGLALENFDATGAWRIKDNEVPVDVVGDLYDQTRMEGPAGLRNALLKHSDMVLRSFTENLMTYALGRRLEYTDMPAVRAIVSGAGKQNNRLSAYVLGVVNSAAFRMSGPESAARPARAAESQHEGSRD